LKVLEQQLLYQPQPTQLVVLLLQTLLQLHQLYQVQLIQLVVLLQVMLLPMLETFQLLKQGKLLKIVD
jgi:hypothetical protein